jgi:Na+-driven multidrug efflux pump
MQGSGATMTSLRINFWTMLLQVPLAYVLAFTLGFGAAGVWLSFPIAFVGKAGLAFTAYRGNKWAVTGVRMPAKT